MNKKASLSGVFIMAILGVMLFLAMNTFLLENIKASGRDVSGDPIMSKIAGSAANLTEVQDDMDSSADQIQADIEGITESNVLIAGLYLAAGVLDVFRYMFESISYVTSGINALFSPLLTIPGFKWLVAGLISVLTVYIIFKILSAVSGRTNL